MTERRVEKIWEFWSSRRFHQVWKEASLMSRGVEGRKYGKIIPGAAKISVSVEEWAKKMQKTGAEGVSQYAHNYLTNYALSQFQSHPSR